VLTTDTGGTGGTATIDPRTGTNTLPTVSTTGETLNVLDPVSVTGTSTGVLTTDGTTIGTIPKIDPKLDVTTPVTPVPVPLKPTSSSTSGKKPASSDTGGGLPVSQDSRTVGKSGMYTPQELTQLYDKLTQNNTQVVQPVSYSTQVIPNSPLADYEAAYNTEGAYGAYAQGGAVQHFKEGDEVTGSSTSTEGLTPRQAANMIRAATADREQAAQYGGIQKSLANLGAITGPTPQRPNVAMVGRSATTSQYEPRVLPQLAALLQSRGMKLAGGGDVNDENPEEFPDQAHPNYDGTPTFRTGGLEGLGGKYVEGKGNGTSDDITAMLANGEYVFSADVVAALGNGSNKSGAEELDKMVEAIRKRARSAPPDKLSPDAKPPLEYLKSTKTQRG
jgi:hypothetical protein